MYKYLLHSVRKPKCSVYKSGSWLDESVSARYGKYMLYSKALGKDGYIMNDKTGVEERYCVEGKDVFIEEDLKKGNYPGYDTITFDKFGQTEWSIDVEEILYNTVDSIKCGISKICAGATERILRIDESECICILNIYLLEGRGVSDFCWSTHAQKIEKKIRIQSNRCN